jgi:hypothetical protein
MLQGREPLAERHRWSNGGFLALAEACGGGTACDPWHLAQWPEVAVQPPRSIAIGHAGERAPRVTTSHDVVGHLIVREAAALIGECLARRPPDLSHPPVGRSRRLPAGLGVAVLFVTAVASDAVDAATDASNASSAMAGGAASALSG